MSTNARIAKHALMRCVRWRTRMPPSRVPPVKVKTPAVRYRCSRLLGARERLPELVHRVVPVRRRPRVPLAGKSRNISLAIIKEAAALVGRGLWFSRALFRRSLNSRPWCRKRGHSTSGLRPLEISGQQFLAPRETAKLFRRSLNSRLPTRESPPG